MCWAGGHGGLDRYVGSNECRLWHKRAWVRHFDILEEKKIFLAGLTPETSRKWVEKEWEDLYWSTEASISKERDDTIDWIRETLLTQNYFQWRHLIIDEEGHAWMNKNKST